MRSFFQSSVGQSYQLTYPFLNVGISFSGAAGGFVPKVILTTIEIILDSVMDWGTSIMNFLGINLFIRVHHAGCI